MKYMVIAVASLALAAITSLTGCSTISYKPYVPGENFGNSGETRCGTRQTVDGYFPGCPPPMDGDEWDPRNGG